MRFLQLLLLPTLVLSLVARDEITSLPGWNSKLPSRQFSGYLNISNSKHLHYWLVEAEVDPETAPVVLWLNGGPGCSSLDGLFYEHGPFRISDEDHLSLERFNYTWARLAHMVYLEAPVGVGFSYSDDKSDYNTNDDKTAHDNMLAVEKFFELYPEYKGRDFYITGESYGGVYVPTLAEAIIKNTAYTGAKLRGIAVGNGCTGTEIGVCGGHRDQFDTEYLLGQAFVPEALKAQIRAACDWSEGINAKCSKLITEMGQLIGNINLYNIYGDCISGSDEEVEGRLSSKAPIGNRLGGPNACIDSIKESDWMNREVVYQATHVVQQPFRWKTCANQINYTSNRPNLPRDTYPLLVENIRVLIYNGDWDACVPYTDNEAWTSGMGYKVAAPWHPWTYNNGQVGGYATRYQGNLTFITIRGGRHEVPETAPDKAFEMLKRLLEGEDF